MGLFSGWDSTKTVQDGRFKGAQHRLQDKDNIFDVIVAGAGPAGSTCAYYLAQFSKNIYAGTTPLRIGLLDKATFPRDKYCGDAWCLPALEILEDMGVLQELEKEKLVCDCLCGGFVSPAGHSFIANDRETPAELKNMSTRCYAIKRKICDERIAREAGRQVGVTLIENAKVDTTTLDEETGVWTICCDDGRAFQCRMLVAADGAASNIARSLNIVKDPPQGVAARRYVKPGTHNFNGDGVLLYPDYTLPGYAALFRHYDNSIDLGLYLLPGGAATDSDLAEIYEKKLMTDPFVSRALGPNVEFSERLKVASLRLGGVEKSYGNHIVLVGDAAGQVDPLTGEGIHTGMIGGKLAAQAIAEMFRRGNFTAVACKTLYHDVWWHEFGSDFPLSAVAGKIVYRLPFLMDAVPKASQGKGGKAGADFFADFGAVMTGAKPKSTFLLPSVAIPLGLETLKQFLGQYIFKNERSYYTDPKTLKDREIARETSWDAQCLIDKNVEVATLKTEPNEESMSNIFRFADDTLPPVLILFGTEYGFSKDLALILAEKIGETGLASPRCLNMAQAHAVVDWATESIIFAVCSTAGDGEAPVEARPFFDFLAESRVSLKHIEFSILAPGDTAYPKFAQAGKDLRQLFLGNGAKECVPFTTLASDDVNDGMGWITSCSKCKVPPAGSSPSMEDYLRVNVRLNMDLFVEPVGATRKAPFLATMKSKHLLTTMENPNDKETWHIEIDISKDDGMEQIQYEPGDALGVQPENDPDLVQQILGLLDIIGDGTTEAREQIQSKLEESDLKNSLNDLKVNVDEEHVIDVLEKITDVKKRRDLVLNKLKPLQPRYYSIASCPKKDSGSVHLCVAAVRYDLLSKRRLGVASTYLCDRLKIGDKVRVWVQRNPDFRPKPKSIMIGPGTGIAPFRSFIRSGKMDRAMLFFGCRYETRDYLYREELEAWNEKEKGRVLINAFSRDQSEKIYVQHRLQQHQQEVWDLLSQDDTNVYICGEGLHMASEVKKALYELIMKKLPCSDNNEKPSMERAIQYLEKRLHLDVWV